MVSAEMRLLRLALVGVICFVAPLAKPSAKSHAASCGGHAELSEWERNEFIAAAYTKKDDVAVEVLAEDGCQAKVLQSLKIMGATISYAEEKVGYIAVRLPNIKVLDVLDVPGIQYATTGLAFEIEDHGFEGGSGEGHPSYVPTAERKVAPVPPIVLPVPRVGRTLSVDGPFFPATEAGLTELWKEHPEADGRGVRIGVLDQGLDLLHPALEVAKDAKGNEVPKVADAMTATTPDTDSRWVEFGAPISTVKGTFEAAGRKWTAPQDGTYRFGIFSKTIWLGDYYGGKPEPGLKSASVSVGVLWDERSNRVWVDTNGDGSFRDQRALGDYGETHDVDWFGHKEGKDDNRVPFGVKIDRPHRAAFLTLAFGSHGAYIAGPLAANRVTGGLFDGAAPNAQLVDAGQRRFMPALLALLARNDVDVVNFSGGLACIWPNGLCNFQKHLVERALNVYDKPMACLCGLGNALMVGDYQSPETYRRNRQVLPPYVESLRNNALMTPDGMQPILNAPSNSLVTESRYMADTKYHFGSDGKRYDDQGKLVPYAPPGYDIGANPSPTIPVVSGVLADLISEARREHIRYNAARLIQAVRIGARQIKGIPTSQQVYGVVNAAGAWNQLLNMSRGDDPRNPELTSFTIGRMQNGKRETVFGFFSDQPQAGGTLQGELWITRHGGFADGRDYRLTLRADDGTFQGLNNSIKFIKDRAERVRFTAKLTPGFHLAFLQLADAQAAAVMWDVPLAVRVPDDHKPLSPWIDQYQATIPPRAIDYRHISLGSDTQAVRYVMRIPYLGAGVDSMTGLPGHQRFGTPAPDGKPVDAANHVGPMLNVELLAANDGPEMKDIYWSNRAGSEYEGPSSPPAPDVPITDTLTVEKFAVSFKNEGGKQVRAVNEQAAVTGRVEFYDAKVSSSQLSGTGPHAIAALNRAIPAKVSQWRVSVTSPSAEKETVDAFLMDCTVLPGDEKVTWHYAIGKHGCTVEEHQMIVAGHATLAIDDPRAGDWKVVVRSREAMTRALSFHVTDALLTPHTGADAEEHYYASGETWSIQVPDGPVPPQYVAFRLKGEPFRILDDFGKELVEQKGPVRNASAKETDANVGVRIAVTPLAPDAP